MSIEIIKKQIDKFLGSDEPAVIALKGAWGVGKTFTWRKFLLEAKTANRVSLARYSYVSLFGINSFDSFRYAIFENVIDRELIGTSPDIETFKKNTTSLITASGRRSLNFWSSFPLVKNFTRTIDSLTFLSLSKTLICIDDLERKGKDLAMKDILGLVSQLKEQKNCKIVLLLNDDEEGSDDYVKYREKVVDIEVKFAPTAEECASIAFEVNSQNYEDLQDFAKKLDIRNIRILKKIEKLIGLAEPYWKDCEPEIRHQFGHSLTLFTWCFYSSGSHVPSLAFVTRLGHGFMEDTEEEAVAMQHKRWKTLLSSYDYSQTDELDLVLAEAVRTGYFDEERLKLEVRKKDAQIKAAKSAGSFTEAWRLYHDTFSNNQDELVATLYESFKKNASNITPTNLNGTVGLFRELDENKKASELIDFYIDERKQEVELFNLGKSHFFGDVLDEEIRTKFNSTYSASLMKENAKQVLQRICDKSGWNQKDEIILANTTADEYYELFMSEDGGHLSSYVSKCLQFGNLSNPTQLQTQITARAREALLRIASQSKVNRVRVRKFGIQPDDA